MAKKVVATLKKVGGVSYTRALKLVKSSKGAYAYEEKIIIKDDVKNFFNS
jgi:hypothetical protein